MLDYGQYTLYEYPESPQYYAHGACPKPYTQRGVSQNEGYFLEDSNKKDYSILGSILGSPYLGKLPNPKIHP